MVYYAACWGRSSAGRASGSQSGGREFNSSILFVSTNGAIVKWLRHRPFTAGSWVQIPLASLNILKPPNVGGFYFAKLSNILFTAAEKLLYNLAKIF